MKALHTLWEFSRPHTLIGTSVSLLCLFLMAAANAENFFYSIGYFSVVLAAALCCNIFITGYNQVCDISIDKINKPNLPIPSGKLSIQNARIIVFASLFMALLISLLINTDLFLLISIIAFIGFAYSSNFFFLKKHHFTATLAIVAVRGLLINLGFFYVFSQHFTETGFIAQSILFFSIHIVLFSIGIAWFKDIPDTKGDEKFEVKTLALSSNPQKALNYGIAVVSCGYLLMIFTAPFVRESINAEFTQISHALLLIIFLVAAFRCKVYNSISIRRFYMFFWLLFFIEYLIFAAAFYI